MAKYIGETALAELVSKMKAYADNAGIVEITSSTNIWELADGVYRGSPYNFKYKPNTAVAGGVGVTYSNAILFVEHDSTYVNYQCLCNNTNTDEGYGVIYFGIASSGAVGSKIVFALGTINSLTSTSTVRGLSAAQGKALKELIDGLSSSKQDTLTFDTSPTASSTNPVTSGGIYTSLTGNGISSIANKGLSTNDFDATYKGKLDGIASGAQVNVIEGVKSGSTTFTPTSKVVDIQGVNNLTNYYTKTQVDSLISSVYTPAGSVAFASLPTLSASVLGNVYNVTDAFTTTTDFVEGAGKAYPAGTNVVVVDIGSSTYKFDVLAGFVDLSGYVPTTRTINGKALSSNITLSASDVSALPSSTTYVASVKSIKTDNTTAQSTSSSEAISGSGTINLHKIAKTGTYSDLISAPSNQSAASGGTTVSLVTTGEKYTWNNKQDAMTELTTSEVDTIFDAN